MPGPSGDDADFEDLRDHDQHGMAQLFWSYGRGYYPEFAVGGAATFLSRGLELVPALVLGVAIDALFFDSRTFEAALPLWPDPWVPPTDAGKFWLAVGLIAGAFFIGAGLNWLNSWAWNRFAQHMQHEVRVDAYAAMQGLEMGFFDDKQTGEVMSILNNDVNQLESFLTSDLNSMIRIVVMVGGVGLIMFLLNWQLALVAFGLIPVLAVASYAFVTLIQPKYGRVRASVGSLNSRLENNLAGIQVIKSYTTEDFEAERVEASSREYLDANWSAISTRIKFWPTMQVLTGLGYVATFLLGGWWVLFGPPSPFTGTLQAGVLVTFLMYSRRFMWPMRQFGRLLNNYQYARAAGERVVGLMQQPHTVHEREDARELTDVEGRVAYDGVDFGYDPDEPVLRDVSFSVEPGEMVGVVGPTGAGKSTLLKLLLRFYDPGAGTVRVDGRDVREYTLHSLRSAMGYVSQDPYLFYGTVRENIAYATPDATDADVEAAARMAGAHEFVTELPDGYDTTVGERGVKLSGGQRQRVSIARAVLRDPEILLLDEATSHVDNETEVVIQHNLAELVADRTTFAIAHRLSTVRHADTILVMDGGRIVESGTHDELLEAGGLYANLWGVQVGEVEDLPESFVRRAAGRVAQD